MTRGELKRYTARFQELTRRIRHITGAHLIEESAKERDRRVSWLLQPEHYGAFFSRYFGSEAGFGVGTAPCAPFHLSAYRDLVAQPFLTQFRLWFRGSAKSVQTNIGNAFGLKCLRQLRFMLLVGMNESRAKLLLSDIQAQLEANERIIQDFGPQVQYGSWRDGAFETRDGCYFMALGIDQPFRGLRRHGNRLDFVVIDDVEDRKKAKNQGLVRERCDKILGDIGGAFGKDRQRMVICNNFIVKNGVIDHLRSRLSGKVHVSFSEVNLTLPDGSPSWYGYHTAEDVARIQKKYDSHTLQREFYNCPVEEEVLFRRAGIHFVDVGKELPKGLVGYWDLSYKKDGDYKAFVLIGRYSEKYAVLDLFCRQTELSQAMAWHYRRADVRQRCGWTPLYYYDATAAQEAVFGPLLSQAAQGSYHIPLPHRNPSVDKHIRIEATLTHAFFHGQLVFDERLKENPDTESAIEQLLAFEKGGKAHDDFPDALENALRLCQQKYPLGRGGQRIILKPRSGMSRRYPF